MADPNKNVPNSAEAPSPVVEKPKFDIRKALDTKGFLEFLTKVQEKNGEVLDMANEGAIGEKFEAFTVKEKVKAGVKNLYQTSIKSEFGVTLEAADLRSVDDHWDALAIADPEKVMEMNDKLKDYVELPKQIKAAETELALLGGEEDAQKSLEEAKKLAEALLQAKNYSGFFGGTKFGFLLIKAVVGELGNLLLNRNNKFGDYAADVYDVLISRRTVKDKYGKDVNREKMAKEVPIVEKQITQIQETLKSIKDITTRKEESAKQFAKLRKELIGGVAGFNTINEVVKRKTKEKLDGFLKVVSLPNIKSAQTTFDNLKKAIENTETGLNPLDSTPNSINPEVFQKDIDTGVDLQMNMDIGNALAAVKLDESGSFSKLEKALKKDILEKDKIGSKEGEELRDFIVSKLEAAGSALNNSSVDKAKKMMVSVIIANLKK
ncbi:MAG: hypothetical protein NTV72_00610 [Candidatus Taylorbacteria bacterium]|nr:hypothetical protein [Candidatus Taylorbacteria bacterium]